MRTKFTRIASAIPGLAKAAFAASTFNGARLRFTCARRSCGSDSRSPKKAHPKFATESPAAVVAYAVDLLTPGDEESTHAFKIGYARALQDSPHVVLAHRAAMLALRAIA